MSLAAGARLSLDLAEGDFLRGILGLLLLRARLAGASLALRAAGERAPTTAVGAKRLSSQLEGRHHWRPGRFVQEDPLDLGHRGDCQPRDQLQGKRQRCYI